MKDYVRHPRAWGGGARGRCEDIHDEGRGLAETSDLCFVVEIRPVQHEDITDVEKHDIKQRRGRTFEERFLDRRIFEKQ